MDFRKQSGFVMSIRRISAAPFIYSLIIPLVILDVFIEIYHQVAFRLYNLQLIDRSQYIKVDRHKLKYLSLFEKSNCLYCSYANGLMHYGTAIAGSTEKYWCGIKHKAGNGFRPPEHHKDFLRYGDEKAFKKYVNKK